MEMYLLLGLRTTLPNHADEVKLKPSGLQGVNCLTKHNYTDLVY